MSKIILLLMSFFLSFCAEKDIEDDSNTIILKKRTVMDSNDIIIGTTNRYYTSVNQDGSREHFVVIDSPKGFTYTLGIDDHVFTDFTIYSSKDRFIENGVLANVGMKETEFWSEAEYSGAYDDQSPKRYFTVVSTIMTDIGNGINVTHLYLCRDANQTSTAGEMGIQYKFQKNANSTQDDNIDHPYSKVFNEDLPSENITLDTLRECSYEEVGLPENIAFPLYFINENGEKEEITDETTNQYKSF